MTPDVLTQTERRALRLQAFCRRHKEWSRGERRYPFLDQQIARLRFWRWAYRSGRVSL